MNRESESAAMRPLARALTKNLDRLRTTLRDHCLKSSPDYTRLFSIYQIKESLIIFDKLFAEFELSYVSAMVPVKTAHEYDMIQEITVLFSETVQRAIKQGLLTQDNIDEYDPALMFTIPRLAIVSGVLIFKDGPLNPDNDPWQISEMFRPFQTLLIKIRELLSILSPPEMQQLESSLCSQAQPSPLATLERDKEREKQEVKAIAQAQGVTEGDNTSVGSTELTAMEIAERLEALAHNFEASRTAHTTHAIPPSMSTEVNEERRGSQGSRSLSSGGSDTSSTFSSSSITEDSEEEEEGGMSDCEAGKNKLGEGGSIVGGEESKVGKEKSKVGKEDSNVGEEESQVGESPTVEASVSSGAGSQIEADSVVNDRCNSTTAIACSSDAIGAIKTSISDVIPNNYCCEKLSKGDMQPESQNINNVDDTVVAAPSQNSALQCTSHSTQSNVPTSLSLQPSHTQQCSIISQSCPSTSGLSPSSPSVEDADLARLVKSDSTDSGLPGDALSPSGSHNILTPSDDCHNTNSSPDDGHNNQSITPTPSPPCSAMLTCVNCDINVIDQENKDPNQLDCATPSLGDFKPHSRCDCKHKDELTSSDNSDTIELCQSNEHVSCDCDNDVNAQQSNLDPNPPTTNEQLPQQSSHLDAELSSSHHKPDSLPTNTSVVPCLLTAPISVLTDADNPTTSITRSSSQCNEESLSIEIVNTLKLSAPIQHQGEAASDADILQDFPIRTRCIGTRASPSDDMTYDMPVRVRLIGTRASPSPPSSSSSEDQPSTPTLTLGPSTPTLQMNIQPGHSEENNVSSENNENVRSPVVKLFNGQATSSQLKLLRLRNKREKCRGHSKSRLMGQGGARMKDVDTLRREADLDCNSSDTSSYTSDSQDREEIALAVEAAERATRSKVRAQFKSSGDMIHRLFVVISGVADQLQTNYAGDLRNILRAVFDMNCSYQEDVGDDDKGEDTTPLGAAYRAIRANRRTRSCGQNNEPPSWIPDEQAIDCMTCQVPFTFVRRRHHCRNCGKIFCSQCSSHFVPLPHFGEDRPVRVCNRCFMFHVTHFTQRPPTLSMSS